ncbi:uncharacterized protein LOC115676428 isoform X2 [Syzygium oleosum]|uniref:uncharacterized protein LOC115676428 isoform X2 n=1 Tax=Syzygium oleosum TaxID=219896 RepID=UPI0024BBD09A|nr:uncharacterized protein LOC115676428 isoform X2 [Syzygium oleosum]
MNSRPPMEAPPYADHHRHHHHRRREPPRFAPPPPPAPPPPHRPHFPEDPSVYIPHHRHHHHHHHHLHDHHKSRQLLLPPQPLPPPPPPPLQPHPPSQSYNPLPAAPPPPPVLPPPSLQSPFTFRTFNPIDDDRRRRSVCPHNNNRLSDVRRPELAIVADNHVSSPYVQVDLDRDSRYHVKRNADAIPRFRDDGVDGFESRRQDDFSRMRSVIYDGSFRSSVSSSANIRGLIEDGELFSNDRMDLLSEKHRRYSHRQVPSVGLHDLVFETRDHEISDVDGMPYVSGESQVHESDWGRYSSSARRSRVGFHEYSVTPKKQVQKKSAFLRLQLPRADRRNGDDERLHSFNHRDESGSGSFRGKGPLVFPDHVMKEKREGRSVELDVSFKSNSLVAKAVVAPTSSLTTPDKDLTPRTKRLKSIDALNGGFTSSLINKPDKSMVYLTRPPEFANCTLKDSKPSEEGVVAASDTGSKINNQPCSKGTSSSVGKGKAYKSYYTPLLDQDSLVLQSGIMAVSGGKVNETHSEMNLDSYKVDTSMSYGKGISFKTGIASGSDSGNIRGIENDNILANKSPTVKIEKKKKVTKKAVKRVRVVKKIKPHSEMMTSKHLHGNDDHMRTDSPGVTGFDEGANPSKEDTTCAAMFHDVGANDVSNEVSDLLQTNDVKGKFQGVPLRECGRDPIILETSLPQDIGENCGAPCPIHSAVVEEIKACHTNSDSFLGCLHTNSSSLENIPAPPSKNTFETGIEKFSSMHENDAARLSYMLGNGLPSLSSLKDMNIHGVSTGNTVPSRREITVSSSDKFLVRSQDPSAASGLRVPDASDSNSYHNQVSASDLRVAGGNSSKFAGSSTGCNPATSSANLDENTTFKDSTIFHDLRQSSSVDLPASLDIHDSKGSLSIAESPVEVLKNRTTNVIDIRQDGVSQLDLPTSNTAETCRETVNISCCSPSDALDICINLPVKDFGLLIATASRVGCLDSGLPSGSHRHDVSHGNELIDELSDSKDLSKKGIGADEYGNPSTYKKRGTTSSHPGFSDLATYQSNDMGLLADSHASCSEMQLTACNSLKQPDVEVATPPMNTLDGNNSSPSWIAKDISSMKSVDAVRSAANRSVHDPVQLPQSVFDSGLLGVGASSIRNEFSLSQSIMEENQKDNIPVKATSDHLNGVLDIEKNRAKKVDLHSVKAQVMGLGEMADCRSSGAHVLTQESGSLIAVRKTDSDIHEVEESPSVSTYVPSSADGDGIYNSNSNDEGIDSVLHPISDMSSPENISNYLVTQIPRWKSSIDEIPPGRLGVKDAQEKENLMVGRGSEISVLTLSSHSTKVSRISDHRMETDCISPEKDVILSSEGLKKTENSLKNAEPYGMWNQPNRVMQRSFPGRSSFASKTSKMISSANGTTKSNTWYRPSNSSVSLSGKKPVSSIVAVKRQFTVDTGELYIRKGNSLVRKPGVDTCQSQIRHVTSSAADRINSSGEDDLKRSIGTGKVDNLNHKVDLLGTGGMSASLEKPKTSLLPSGHNLPNHTAMSSEDCTFLNSVGPLLDGCFGIRLDSVDCTLSSDQLDTSKDALKISETREDQFCLANKLEQMKELPNESLTTSGLKKITYVKRKSNQLVATTESCDLPTQIVHKTQVLSSDGYFKRNKNQLIRTSMGTIMKQMSALPVHSRNSEVQGAPAVSCGRRLNRGLSSKVWTLWGSKLSKSYRDPLHHQKCYQKVLPQLFPWKRATYWRRYMQTTCSLDDKSSSAIRRLMLLRKRDTVYVRSAHGLSLRKSKVLSVGGASLKWSKSIERQSKKANEDATRAVVAAEREKKEQNGSLPVSSRTKSKFRSSRAGERVFRIGSVRYKMDASKRTLQRISDDESAYSSVSQAKDDTRKSYVPRRLVIGNDEYVRIGNGNQLIRDPKKRTRLLASEKVRWSLHTARLRLTKKRKYCQFFTRFGKCNKDDGKCPYIHDPSKIAVCTKFINGSCSNKDCKLTHEVIPERMPDCSYFLQGLCTNKNCPYRHVNVNQNYPTCQAFLRGYCPDGNECRKKHSYICPTFEATGRCQQGSKCKLHHPKGRIKGKKRKRSGEKSSLGRYFGSMTIRLSKQGTAASERVRVEDNDDNTVFSDYISLDVSDDEERESDDPMIFDEIDPLDVRLDDLDEQIKPIRIMDRMPAM